MTPWFYLLAPAEPATTASNALAYTDDLADNDLCYFVDGGIPSECVFPFFFNLQLQSL